VPTLPRKAGQAESCPPGNGLSGLPLVVCRRRFDRPRQTRDRRHRARAGHDGWRHERGEREISSISEDGHVDAGLERPERREAASRIWRSALRARFRSRRPGGTLAPSSFGETFQQGRGEGQSLESCESQSVKGLSPPAGWPIAGRSTSPSFGPWLRIYLSLRRPPFESSVVVSCLSRRTRTATVR
jgi:hypothetical protein